MRDISMKIIKLIIMLKIIDNYIHIYMYIYIFVISANIILRQYDKQF